MNRKSQLMVQSISLVCLLSKDIVQAPEVQKQKKFFYRNEEKLVGEQTSLLNSPDMLAHTAEVLRQVEGATVEQVGGSVEMLGLDLL
jgi:hypothetical protein